ncbi:PREDICTED: uncharacterized protein LOC106303276 [Brassica oleracea var. oleracea]|uniref:uncharacterized protein LOC106303276 n=1 Tax=Brassica oleracea var. oleracea TaxID=109376 RepID=UPI0006A6C26F|nr:PREDICTED: uncharacterized protein LOC106303276 [Brassica oleracea var. oleracea]
MFIVEQTKTILNMSSSGLDNATENPTLELKITSASVENIDATDKIDVYAVISINGSATQKKRSAKTPIDYDGGSNPTWNHTVKFSFNEREANEGLLNIKVELYSYWLEDENDVSLGEVNVPVQELLATNPLPPFSNGDVSKMKPVTYPIKFIGETKPNGKLSLSYRFKPAPVHDLYPTPLEPVYLPPFVQPGYTNPDPARLGQPVIYTPQCQTQTTVTELTIELVIKSANNIRNVNVFDDMDVYASVMICEGKTTKHKTKTPIAYSGFKFPTWNHAVKFSLGEEKLAREDRFSLVVELMSHRRVMGDKHIGKVSVQIQELIGSNPPSPCTDVDINNMKLVTHKVGGVYGEGTLSFTYRFLEEQVAIPIVPGTTPQPFIMYVPVPHHPYGSANPVHGASGYMAIHPGVNIGPSNGQVPNYMPPSYQPHEYHQYSHSQLQPQPQPQVQLSPQKFQNQPQPQVQIQQQPQPQQPLPQRPTQSPAQGQGVQPQVKPQGGSVAALGLGAAFGRVIGGAILSEIMSNEVNLNLYEV